jgi:hypothetical protein
MIATVLRGFSLDVEDVAARWRASVETVEMWRHLELPEVEEGEGNGYPVQNVTGRRGYLKPCKLDRDVPRAAQEKIASDLAYELILPVPPVILWRRLDALDGEEDRVCISLFPFRRTATWKRAITDANPAPGLVAQLVQAATIVASAMMPFDTWISHNDREDDRNVVVDEDDVADGTSSIRLAYIDCAYSLSSSWSPSAGPRPWSPMGIGGRFPTGIQPDPEALRATIRRIECLRESVIGEIVNRIPDDYLSAEPKQRTMEGLIHRQAELRTKFRAAFPGV